jgi:hypothetical protein
VRRAGTKLGNPACHESETQAASGDFPGSRQMRVSGRRARMGRVCSSGSSVTGWIRTPLTSLKGSPGAPPRVAGPSAAEHSRTPTTSEKSFVADAIARSRGAAKPKALVRLSGGVLGLNRWLVSNAIVSWAISP